MNRTVYNHTTVFVEDQPSVRLRAEGKGLIVEWDALTMFFTPQAAVAMVSEIKHAVEEDLKD